MTSSLVLSRLFRVFFLFGCEIALLLRCIAFVRTHPLCICALSPFVLLAALTCKPPLNCLPELFGLRALAHLLASPSLVLHALFLRLLHSLRLRERHRD